MDSRTLLNQGFRYALSLTHDVQDAEDLLQDAWARVLNAGGPRHKGYLYATIRNAFVDRVRRDNVVQFVPAEEPEPLPEGPRDEEQRHVDRQLLGQALGVLRPEEREALYLSAVEGYTAAEIGELSDRPRNTVLSLIHRARLKVLAAFPIESAKEVL